MENDLVKLTVALYKVTELFPQEEPLRRAVREKALEILADGVLVFADDPLILSKEKKKNLVFNLERKVKLIQSYFKVAREQDWVNELNFEIIGQEYLKLKEKVLALLGEEREEQKTKATAGVLRQKSGLEDTKHSPVGDSSEREGVASAKFSLQGLKNERHKKIIKILQKKGDAQVRDFEPFFPGTAKRTLRRDMGYLVNLGFLKRVGDKSNTLYKLRQFNEL